MINCVTFHKRDATNRYADNYLGVLSVALPSTTAHEVFCSLLVNGEMAVQGRL